jgi:hypothetical protein
MMSLRLKIGGALRVDPPKDTPTRAHGSLPWKTLILSGEQLSKGAVALDTHANQASFSKNSRASF